MPTKTTINSELHNCTHELNMLMAQNHLPNDFRKILHAIVNSGRIIDQNIAPDDMAFKSTPPAILIIRFSTHFLLTTVNDVKIRLDSVNLGTTGGWRRATQVVKHMHYVLKTYGRASKIFYRPIQIMCEAIATGLWMDEENVVAAEGADERNGFMLNLLLNVGNELKALSDNDSRFYDFLGVDSKQTMGVIIQFLRQVPMAGLDSLRQHAGSNNHEPAPPLPHAEHEKVITPPTNQQKLILPPPPVIPDQVVKKGLPPPGKHNKTVGSVDLKSFLNETISLLKRLSDSIDNQDSATISMGISCFVDVTQRAVYEINGADLAINAHWNHAADIMVLVQQTASDLEFWSAPLHKGLSEMFMAIQTGLCATHEQVEWGNRNPQGRSACIFSLLAKTGDNLYALSRQKATFFDFLGTESAKTMQIIISLLLSSPHTATQPTIHHSTSTKW